VTYLKERRKRDGELIIERRIIGREFTVGVLNGEPLAVTEIIPKKGFYDYNNKYTKGATEEITPADIDKELEAELKATALRTHSALRLGAYSRIDIMVEAETDRIYVLEANAIPGMTETSLLPQGAAAVGIDFDTLCEKMLKAAL
jgi:D-alanine-D-alanine ligase